MKLLAFILILVPFICKGQDIIRFTMFSDLHHDIIPDADNRLMKVFEAAKKNNSDFIIQLGDFAIHRQANNDFVDCWNNYPLEKYSVLGNHDLDVGTKEQYVHYLKMEAPYYFFDKGIFRFVILDTNYFFG